MKSTKKKIFHFLRLLMLFFPIGITALFASCDDTDKKSEYDPSRPVKISEIYPKSGGFHETVVLRGENFGGNPKQIRVFFNKKEAVVVGASGNRVLVYVPKLPGEDCKIKMLVGENTKDTIFGDEHFKYISNFQLQLVCGLRGSSGRFKEGTLQTTQMDDNMRFICCDNEGIVYIGNKQQWNGALAMLNEKEGYTKMLAPSDGTSPIAAVYDPSADLVYYCGHEGPYFWLCDPNDSWTVQKRQLVGPNQDYIQNKGYLPLPSGVKLESLYSYAHAGDDFIYCRAYNGAFFKFKPVDRVYSYVTQLASASCFLCVDPYDDMKLYCSQLQNHVITCIDLTKDPSDPSYETIICGKKGSIGGFMDGSVEVAQMNEPQQIAVALDPETGDKVIYICDSKNRCIRQFNLVTKMVKTVAGTPQEQGYDLGDPLNSKMNLPTGICVNPLTNDLYIADQGNHLLLKLAFL